MRPNELNRKAWEIAVLAMVRRGRGVEAYSTGQIRSFFEQARSPNFYQAIMQRVDRYSPQPSDGRSGNEHQVRQEMSRLREVNKKVTGNVAAVLQDLSAAERIRFTQYLLWNIRIIEQFSGKPDKIRMVLLAEGISNPDDILRNMPEVQRNNQNERPRRR